MNLNDTRLAWNAPSVQNPFFMTKNVVSRGCTRGIMKSPMQDSSHHVHSLIIDNYDSYTYNLKQMCGQVNHGYAPTVIPNDYFEALTTKFQNWAAKLAHLNAQTSRPIDNIILSPGPGRPEHMRDFGLCHEILQEEQTLPILGVCLGHQGMAWIAGATIDYAPRAIHGEQSRIQTFGESRFWDHIPTQIQVVRYHSLVVARESLVDFDILAETIPTARDPARVIMAIQHRSKPWIGVQFHPESIQSEYGYQMLQNFRDISMNHKTTSVTSLQHVTPAVLRPQAPTVMRNTTSGSTSGTTLTKTLYVKKLPMGVPVRAVEERIFEQIFASQVYSFWLDSSNHEAGAENSRFSYMGDISGPCARRLEYHAAKPAPVVSVISNTTHETQKQTLHHSTIWEYLRKEWQVDAAVSIHWLGETNHGQIPFSFQCGFVGYFGYESSMNHNEGKQEQEQEQEDPVHVPDAAFLFTDRILAFDHEKNELYLLCYCDHPPRPFSNSVDVQSQEWFDTMSRRIQAELSRLDSPPKAQVQPEAEEQPDEMCLGPKPQHTIHIPFVPARSGDTYRWGISSILNEIREGETYEACLTTQMTAQVSISDSFRLYQHLRRVNPAPFAAYLQWNPKCQFAICCSSPERFLQLKASAAPGWIVESKPIKGTRKRNLENAALDRAMAQELASAAKDQSENLMITDLVRNDLGQVCDIGSVHVPQLFQVETFANVHQLVSTVRGFVSHPHHLTMNTIEEPTGRCVPPRIIIHPADVIQAAFPGGSMTGAPKTRSMDILRRVEEGTKRGVYAGALGYLSLDGSLDLNIVIRTMVVTPGKVKLGSGGAILALSDVEEELDEVLLKTARVTRALEEYLNSNSRVTYQVDVQMN